ncbi:MAG TPA: hypothetical protein VFQ20_07060 [Burkholderiaceae bacterium]|nr:hypothetical protein [Burkholderiaceae bacterium]
MHAPPPVRVTVAADRPWIAACGCAAATAAGNFAAWLGLPLPLLLLATLAGGLSAAWLAWRRSVPGALAWDGQAWLWEAAGGEPVAGGVTVAIDLDRWMLLAFAPAQGARRWLALSRRAVGGTWSPLRAALFGARPSWLP